MITDLKNIAHRYLPKYVRKSVATVLSPSKVKERYMYRALEDYMRRTPLEFVLYDPAVDAVRVSQSGRETLNILRAGMIAADAVPMLLKAEAFVPHGGVVFDVGAYRGITAQRFAQRANAVYAFEPVPENIRSIERAIQIRSISNIELIKAAVSKDAGKKEFYVYEMRGHSSLGKAQTEKIARTISVDTITLDEFSSDRDIKYVDCLKIDAEGFEYEVLGGSIGLMKDQRIGNVVFEANAGVLRGLGKSIGAVCDILAEYGYDIYDLDGQMVSRSAIEDCAFGDFLAKPHSRGGMG